MSSSLDHKIKDPNAVFKKFFAFSSPATALSKTS
tara:strand:+ start:654 stop:755 length:102 start_codon:yes stop_codon:yes gene_type:complete